jgi:hypothetical protein
MSRYLNAGRKMKEKEGTRRGAFPPSKRIVLVLSSLVIMEEYDQTELKFEHNGEEYLLRRWRLEDVEDITHHANNEKVSATMSNRFLYPYTREYAEECIRSSMKEFVLSKDDSKDPMMWRFR